MFIRTGYLATAAQGSPLDKMMTRMESAFAESDVAEVEKGYAAMMVNMGAFGAIGAAEDNAIVDYLDQFDAIFA